MRETCRHKRKLTHCDKDIKKQQSHTMLSKCPADARKGNGFNSTLQTLNSDQSLFIAFTFLPFPAICSKNKEQNQILCGMRRAFYLVLISWRQLERAFGLHDKMRWPGTGEYIGHPFQGSPHQSTDPRVMEGLVGLGVRTRILESGDSRHLFGLCSTHPCIRYIHYYNVTTLAFILIPTKVL